jgi:hypothetical protein
VDFAGAIADSEGSGLAEDAGDDRVVGEIEVARNLCIDRSMMREMERGLVTHRFRRRASDIADGAKPSGDKLAHCPTTRWKIRKQTRHQLNQNRE